MSHVSIENKDKADAIIKDRCLGVYCSGHLVEEIVLDIGGVVGDGHYGKDPERAVMITSTKAYGLAADKGISLEDGELEENILVDIDPYSLPLETRIEIGGAVIELAKYGTICRSLSKIDSRLPKLLKEERGIFAKVIKAGKVRANDTLRVLENKSAKKGEKRW